MPTFVIQVCQERICNAKISKSNVFGINVWDLQGEFKEQKDLIITTEGGSQTSRTHYSRKGMTVRYPSEGEWL
jgi:hypothetical protein